jgi:hypothetical protein
MSLDTYERSLLAELRQHVEAHAPGQQAVRSAVPRRRSLGIAVAGLVTAGAAVAISLGLGVAGPGAAYAVDAQPSGDVVVTVRDLSDAHGLEAALAAKGVEADISRIPGFTQAPGTSDAGNGSGCAIALAKIDGGLQFTLGAAQVASAAVLHIVTSGSSASDVSSPVMVTWSGGGC